MSIFMKLIAIIAVVGNTFVYAAPAEAEAKVQANPKTYQVQIGAFEKEFPIVAVSDSPVSIVYINFRQEMDVIRATVDFMQGHLDDVDIIVAPGDKANGLVTLLSDRTKMPFAILTNKPTPDMGDKPLSVGYKSITSGGKSLYISPGQAQMLKGKRVVIIDDVLTTGGTILATAFLVEQAGGIVEKILVAFTEEDQRENLALKSGKIVPVIKAGHLPVFPVSQS